MALGFARRGRWPYKVAKKVLVTVMAWLKMAVKSILIMMSNTAVRAMQNVRPRKFVLLAAVNRPPVFYLQVIPQAIENGY